MIKMIDETIVRIFGNKPLSSAFTVALSIGIFSLILFVGFWAGLALVLVLVSLMLMGALHNWRETTVEWHNAFEREGVAVNMLAQLLNELADSDPDRAVELARQFVSLSRLSEARNIDEIMERVRDAEKG